MINNRKCLNAKVFSHSISGGAMAGIGILNNDSYWQPSLPHVIESGICFTYEPQFKSQSGRWYGIRYFIKNFVYPGVCIYQHTEYSVIFV